MDRNSTLGLILITLLFLGFFYFSPKPEPQTPADSPRSADTISREDSDQRIDDSDEGLAQLEEGAESDSTKDARLKDRYSDFFPLVGQEGEEVTVTTDKLTLVFDTKGAKIKAAYLNGYKTSDSLPLPVVSPNPNNQFDFEFAYRGREIRTEALIFEPSETSLTLSGNDSAELTFSAPLAEGRSMSFTYKLKGNTYDVGYRMQTKGLRDDIDQSYFKLYWKSYIPKTEQDLKNMRAKTGAVYFADNSIEKVGPTDETEKEELEYTDWISYKSQFFSQILAPEKSFRRGILRMATPEKSESVVRIFNSVLTLDVGSKSEVDESFFMFFGPNEYQALSSYDMEFEEEMDLGWGPIGWINKGTTYVFKFLERYISNYGIIVILLAILIRLLMLPLSFRSYVSQAKMRVINQTPEIKALEEKHKDDPQKLQMAKMSLYRESGTSMFGGCLPMLLSYPFLIALFFFFPQSVELRQQSFLWAHDLSTYDSILSWDATIPLVSDIYGNHVSLFTLLMAISTFVFTIFQQQSQPTANNQFKYIAYIMPIFLLVFLNNYASGLSLYYLTSNVLQISQTMIIRRFFVNDEKLLAEMRVKQKANRKKNKNAKSNGGKGGGQAPQGRVARWVEKQQKKQEELQKMRQQQTRGNNRQTRRRK